MLPGLRALRVYAAMKRRGWELGVPGSASCYRANAVRSARASCALDEETRRR